MNLEEIRTLFGSLSGRLDLTTADANGKYGADQFIKEGSRFLDREGDIGISDALFYGSVQVGSFYLLVPGVRSIESVWYYNSDGRVELEKSTMNRIKNAFDNLLSGDNRERPIAYVPCNFLAEATQSLQSPVDFLGHVEFNSKTYNGILFPPSSTAGTMEISGKFYSKELKNSTDENYWSREHGMLLTWAALYHLEISYRNSEGANDWYRSIKNTLATIEFDHVAQESATVNQLGGREND